jgi:uncharacterized membrane protein
MKPRTLYTVMTIGGAVGMVAAFLQTLEKLVLIANTNAELPCNLSAVFSCSVVLNAWQSSVFGFPNSIMCLVLFTIFTVVGLVGLTGGVVSKGMRLGTQFLTLFTLAFALWFLWQSTYVIGALCIFCLFCFAGLLMVNWAWIRLNITDYPIKQEYIKKKQAFIKSGWDTLFWVSLAAVVAIAMLARFIY